MSWAQLQAILADARRDLADQAAQVPVACPNDGEPLSSGPGGVLFCTFDGWQYPRDWRRPGE